MKVLFITHYGSLYGANRALLSLIKDLRRRYDVSPYILALADGPIFSEAKHLGIPIHRVPYYRWVSSTVTGNAGKVFIKRILNRVFFPEIVHWTRKYQPDIIHTNSSITDLGQRLSSALKVPHVWHLREFGDADYSLKFDEPSSRVAKSLRAADCVIAISKSVEERYKQISSDANYKVVYDGISTSLSSLPLHTPTSKFEFIQVGNLSEYKNQMMTLRAAQQLCAHGISNFHVTIVGNGEEEYTRQLQDYIKENQLNSHVLLAGYRDDISNLLSKSDAGIITSNKEAFGLVTAEYMMAGRPVIGTRTGGTPELIDSKSGILVNANDEVGLYKAMYSLLSDVPLARSLGVNARTRALSHFSTNRNSDQIYEIYSQIVNLP